MKKIINVLLSVLMVLTIASINVVADEEANNSTTVAETNIESAENSGELSEEPETITTILSEPITEPEAQSESLTYVDNLRLALSSSGTDDTIVLNNNVEITGEALVIDRDVTIDMNGFSITGNDVRAILIKSGNVIITNTAEKPSTITSYGNTIEADSSVIRLGDNSGDPRDISLVLEKNVNVSAPKTYGITVFGSKTKESLTVNGNITSDVASAISGNGSAEYGGTNIVVNGEVSTKDNVAIYHPQSGSLTVNGKVTGKGGIEMKSGSIVEFGSDAYVESTADNSDHSANNNGTSTYGYALALVENSAYAGNPTANINTGTFVGEVAIVIDNNVDENKKANLSISGGTFSVRPDDKYLSSGKTVYEYNYAKYKYTVLDTINVAYGTDGLIFTFPSSDYADSLIKGVEIGDKNVYPGFYDTIKFSSQDDYKIFGGISNGKFSEDTYSYIEKLNDKTVKVSIENLKKLGFVHNKEYEICLYDNTNDKTLNLGKVAFDANLNEIDSSLDRVNKLFVTIADDDLKIEVGKNIPSTIKATIKDEHGNEVKNAKVVWARKISVSPTASEKILVNAVYDYYYKDGKYGMDSVETFDAISEYFLVVDYSVNNKNYDDNFELYINNEKVDYNGITLSGFGAGGGLAYCYVDQTDEYSYSKSYGYAKPAISISNSVSATTEEKTVYTNKIEGMFASNSESLTYSNIANNATNNQSIKDAGCDKIVVTLIGASAEKQESNIVAKTMTFDVTPFKADNGAVHGKVSNKITFRLPVDPQADYKYADVYHGDEKIGQYEVKSDASGKYIEVSYDEFSVYSYTLTNTKFVAPSVGGSGSSITRKPVVNTSAK